MWVHNRFLYQTGTIIYENDQVLISGLKSYSSPFIVQTGTKFAVVDRMQYIERDKDSQRERHDVLTVQFGWDEINRLSATGISVEEPGRIRLLYRGQQFRGINVNDMGQPYNKAYMPIGLIEITFERRIPVVN
ncbi:MAG: hypothetical protein FK731_08850 [Asgard group archaeon]|nr:hypothetical protein [Asgard group archaeon]